MFTQEVTVVPSLFLAEAFFALLSWDSSSRTVYHVSVAYRVKTLNEN